MTPEDALRQSEQRAAEAERQRDLSATIALAALGKLTDEQMEELRKELAGDDTANDR